MGNKLSHNISTEGGSEETTPQRIQCSNIEDHLIKNPFEGYIGYLIEARGRNGPRGKVFRTDRMNKQNKHEAIVTIYSYSMPSNPGAADGTYVVLQFMQSQKFFAVHKNKPSKLILTKKGWDPEYAEDITTTADRRVFLAKRSPPFSSDLIFRAASGGVTGFITLAKDRRNKPASLADLGEGHAEEAQKFKIFKPILKPATDDVTGDYLEAVSSPYLPLGGADERSDGCQAQEEQRHG
ncbi:uncharacterized protein LOC144867570 [Branchiostoma floridae x Branchiostoma japonicum]